jgi:hypothetical protein
MHMWDHSRPAEVAVDQNSLGQSKTLPTLLKYRRKIWSLHQSSLSSQLMQSVLRLEFILSVR